MLLDIENNWTSMYDYILNSVFGCDFELTQYKKKQVNRNKASGKKVTHIYIYIYIYPMTFLLGIYSE